MATNQDSTQMVPQNSWLMDVYFHSLWCHMSHAWEGVTRKVVVSQGTRGITQCESRHATGPFSADTKP